VILSALRTTVQRISSRPAVLALPLGGLRVVVGVAALARPELLPSLLGLDASAAQRTAWLARMLGGRDLALGAGTLAGSRGCVAAGAAADAVDALALLAALQRGHVRRIPAVLTVASAAAAAVAGAAAAMITRR
jgi:peptide-methionine (R)-S-oxide reductase